MLVIRDPDLYFFCLFTPSTAPSATLVLGEQLPNKLASARIFFPQRLQLVPVHFPIQQRPAGAFTMSHKAVSVAVWGREMGSEAFGAPTPHLSHTHGTAFHSSRKPHGHSLFFPCYRKRKLGFREVTWLTGTSSRTPLGPVLLLSPCLTERGESVGAV